MLDFRWSMFALWIPASIALGVFIGDFLSVFDKPWQGLSASIVFPALILIGAWFLAPYNKLNMITGLYIVIVGVAFYLSPSAYPAWHSQALQATDLPLITAAGLGGAIVSLFWILSRK